MAGDGLEDALHGVADGLSKRSNASDASAAGEKSMSDFLKRLVASRSATDGESAAGVDASQKAAYETVAGERLEDVQRATVQELSAMGISHLEDFDWSVRVALGSDKLSGQREPLLVLRLRVAGRDGTSREVVVELPKGDVDNVLGTFEDIQQAVRKIKEY